MCIYCIYISQTNLQLVVTMYNAFNIELWRIASKNKITRERNWEA